MIWLIVLIPVTIACLAKFVFKLDICWKEFAIQITAGILAVCLIWFIGSMANTTDKEVLNGAVTSKNIAHERCYTNMSARVCRNSYDCNCYTVCTPTTDSKGNVTGQSCTTYCDTCYRYPWERDYEVKTSVGNFTIDRVDAQGANVPGRYTQTLIGDAASVTHNYQNWVKASSGTLFRDADSLVDKYTGRLPEYPIAIYDYYNINRAVSVGARVPNARQWNKEISQSLSRLGPTRQMNMIIVFANNTDPDYAYALRRHWDGFKKNDAVIYIGLRNGNVAWVESLSWSKDASFDVKTRMYLTTLIGQPISNLNPRVVVGQIEEIGKTSFTRRPMKDFEYLRGDIQPPRWLLLTSILFAIIMGIGASYIFHKNEFFIN